jgi:hypothetical protein
MFYTFPDNNNPTLPNFVLADFKRNFLEDQTVLYFMASEN